MGSKKTAKRDPVMPVSPPRRDQEPGYITWLRREAQRLIIPGLREWERARARQETDHDPATD